MAKYIFACANCGAEVKRNFAQLHDGPYYCSRACQQQGALVTKVCQACGKEFTVRKTQVERSGAKYCSRSCNNRGRAPLGLGRGDPKMERTCERCGTAFKAYVAEVKDGGGKYCSHACADASNGEKAKKEVPCICLACGKPFTSQPNQIEHGGGKFCGAICRTEFQRSTSTAMYPHGPKPNYGPSWKQARLDAWERSGECCEECGKTRAEMGRRPQVHHIKAFRLFGTERHEEANKQDNLICLCPSCHSHKHPEFRRRYVERLREAGATI